ncbi:hypothetical protein BGZ81_007068 [Podila clonocystis]|nr:hypothetical protein BGZ81_007068 [Podila clonocystis]
MVATRRTASTNKDTSSGQAVRIKKNGKSLPVPAVHMVNATNPKKTSPPRKANVCKKPESLSKDTSTSKAQASQPTRRSSRRSGSPLKDEETIVALEITSIAKLAIQSLANAVAGIDIQEQKTQLVMKAETSTPLDTRDPANAAVKATGDSAHQLVEPSTEPRVGAKGQKRKYSRKITVIKPEEDTLREEEEEEEEEEEAESDENIDHSDSDGEFGSPTKRRQKTGKESTKPVKMLKAGISEYERERLENIKRNQEMLQFLQLPATSAVIQVATLEGTPKEEIEAKVKVATPAPKRTFKQRERKEVAPLEIGENDTVDSGESRQKNSGSSSKATSGDITQENEENDSDEENPGSLMSGDLFFDKETRDNAIRVDGHYKGWIHPEVLARYGFEKSAQDAWQAHGGGTFSFKDPLGDMNGEGAVAGTSLAGSHSKSKSKRPKHDARMVSKAMFKKNPNAYFYRHNEPGQEQWTGDWTLEEREIFLQVAREHGCGDKWGLFASHIPHRVGYQCSNFYRQVVLPEGLVFDPNYEYTSRGKPIYCGKYNQRRS